MAEHLKFHVCVTYFILFQAVPENLNMDKMSLSSSTSEKPAETDEDKNGIRGFSQAV